MKSEGVQILKHLSRLVGSIELPEVMTQIGHQSEAILRAQSCNQSIRRTARSSLSPVILGNRVTIRPAHDQLELCLYTCMYAILIVICIQRDQTAFPED